MTVRLVVDERAPCTAGDPERFFPGGQPPEDVLNECRSCPFLGPCLAYALAYDVAGVWAATSGLERQRIRRERGIVPIPIHLGAVTTPPAAERLEQRREWMRDYYHRRKGQA